MGWDPPSTGPSPEAGDENGWRRTEEPPIWKQTWRGVPYWILGLSPVVLIMLLWVAFADNDSGGGGGPSLTPSLAFCSDVKAGMSPFELYQSVPGNWDDMQDFADDAYGKMAISCDDELEGWRWFFEEWNINIDA